VDLLGAWAAAGHLRRFANEVQRQPHPWEQDEDAFLRHFGVPHEEYVLIVSHLTNDQIELLEATIEVNPEAAVLWILSMEELG
jgi:hypothetical protein